MYFPGGARLGSPVLPHATQCPEGGRAANKVGVGETLEEGEPGLGYLGGCKLRCGWEPVSLFWGGHIPTPRGQHLSQGSGRWACKGICPAGATFQAG